MIKIKDMQCGHDNVEFTALISYVTSGKTNGAKRTNYLSITFQDSTGVIGAKLWNATDEQMETLVVGAVVTGKGDIIKYSDERQMKIISIQDVTFDPSIQQKYLTSAPMSSDELGILLMEYVNKIKNPKLYQVTKYLYDQHMDKVKVYPAATKNHHEFLSGLAFHTLSMLKVADALIQVYTKLNADLIYSGILLHDLGKIVELSGPAVPTYTLQGKLLGHISIAQAMVYEASEQLKIEGEEIVLLQHIILSHHGKNEFGSPVLPQIREAELVHLIDNIDARMNMFDKALEQIRPGEYSKRIFALENRMIYYPQMYEENE